MKTLNLTRICTFCTTLFATLLITSCIKEKTIIERDIVNKRDTIIRRDTVIIKDTAVNASILTSGQWKVESIYGMLGNNILGYTRGANNNTQNFDNEYYLFNQDFTGFEIDHNGAMHYIPKWELIHSSGRTTLKMTYYNNINGSISMTILWDYLILKNGMLHFDEYYFNPELSTAFRGKVIRSKKN